ncbi:DUF4129 domain-containing protein [Hyperthermus butylicus]|uniref:Protein-glutamine gamma-glutamyltransferase-like C-terminal domain-containing protein n=1 Tax=Hyperthermus butylicus (strain DSM 5456 / JCM 9403 / PLM1-5) TaxID=415426 RepID=A2BJJ1_HYPBU|nr:DUF4129 domain-containing protein [Hyperthermus butylicus]ABM80152.1 hypothetical protein Hbut_0280 [Hyperthermus butylicus DSM 5456]
MPGIETPHHYIPDLLQQQPAAPTSFVPGNASAVQPETTGVAVQYAGGGSGMDPWLAGLIALVVGLAVVALLLVVSRLSARTTQLPEAGMPQPRSTYMVPPGYRYEGLRLELRRAYLRVLEALRRHGLYLPHGATAGEVGEAARRHGLGSAARVARLYRDHMYSRRGPPRGVVDEAWRLAREL